MAESVAAEFTVATAQAIDSASESNEPEATPLPIFGHRAASPELFERADESIVTADDIYNLGEPLAGIAPGQVEEQLGFVPLRFSSALVGYAVEGLEVWPSVRAVRQCASGLESAPTSLPRFCILQQASPLTEPIGNDAAAFRLETAELYVEYVYGGWLSVGNSWDPVRTFRWDDRMVPVLRIRFQLDGVYTEISCAGGDCPQLGELLTIAEEMY